MALSTDLNIHKAAMDLLRFVYGWMPQVPRSMRGAMANKAVEECGEILLIIGRANESRGEARAFHLQSLLEHLSAVTYILRAAHDLGVMSHKLWAQSIELTGTLGRQTSGWLKSTRSATTAPAA